MMKSILISIKPKWCELIASGEKTIEVRKTKPKCDVPFKCYIYCTNDRKIMLERSNYDKSIYLNGNIYYPHKMDCSLNGKVIGEFVCNNIDRYTDEIVNSSSLENFCGWNDFDLNRACIHPGDLEKYADGKNLYGWHISDLVIYDKPKELSEFFHICEDMSKCENCKYLYTESNESIGYYAECCSPCEGCKPLKRPPQSWCYVERCEE